jgi:hypothetical protein
MGDTTGLLLRPPGQGPRPPPTPRRPPRSGHLRGRTQRQRLHPALHICASPAVGRLHGVVGRCRLVRVRELRVLRCRATATGPEVPVGIDLRARRGGFLSGPLDAALMSGPLPRADVPSPLAAWEASCPRSAGASPTAAAACGISRAGGQISGFDGFRTLPLPWPPVGQILAGCSGRRGKLARTACTPSRPRSGAGCSSISTTASTCGGTVEEEGDFPPSPHRHVGPLTA